MKKALIALGILIVLILIGAGAYLLLHRGAEAPSNTGTTFPDGGTMQGSGQNASGVPQMSVQNQDGSSVHTSDFIHNGITFEDPSNKGDYYLAGTNGLCNPDGTCPKAGDATTFTVIYFSEDSSFAIGITDEPLGANRKAAEQYLMKTLGLSESQMCSLKYTLGTTAYVSDTYGGENLGFSFCPGSVKLP